MANVNRLDLQVSLANALTKAAPLSGGPGQALKLFHAFTQGLNPGQVRQVYFGLLSLLASGTADLDLSGTTLKEEDGTNLALVKLRVLGIYNEGPGALSIFRPAAATGVPLFLAISDGLVLPAGGLFLWSCGATDTGVTVTAATGDLISVLETAALPVTYLVMIAGI
ncbi:MAG: hypothetical protein WC985_03245 [Thermoplasmata archaeon]